MRKLWIAAAGAAVIAVAVAGIAIADNTYTVHQASNSPNPKGSAARPVPTQLKFGYRVGDTENLRPQVIREYFIAAEGLQSFPDARPTCTYAQATASPTVDPACAKAKVGQGKISNFAGAPNDRSQKLQCDVKLTLYNISTGDPRPESRKTVAQIRKRGGLGIRIDTYQPEGSRCPIPVHEALAAPFYDVRIQGVSSAELRFRVPESLAHPGGLDNSVAVVTSTIRRVSGRARVRGERRRVGYYSLVGRKGRTRTTRVTFVDESGDRQTATTTFPK
jgi:hypothetical protein